MTVLITETNVGNSLTEIGELSLNGCYTLSLTPGTGLIRGSRLPVQAGLSTSPVGMWEAITVALSPTAVAPMTLVFVVSLALLFSFLD